MDKLESGTVVDERYEILAAIGSGGLGTVYRARDVNDNVVVAVKMLNIPGDEAQRRFLREFNILSRIRHPRIVRSHHWGVYQGKPYFSMDFICGRNLSELIASREDRETLRTFWFDSFVRQIAEGLAYFHSHGLVHRDLKPSNVMISMDGDKFNVVILDLGLARFQDSRELRLTQPGRASGTVEYMSPEQIRGRAVDQRSDLYSMGIILYEVLTGEPPFTGGNPASVMFQHLRDLPRPPRAYGAGVSSHIQGVVMKLLEKEPIDRYDSVRSLLQDLAMSDDGSIDLQTGRDQPLMQSAPFLYPQFLGREREMKVLREVLRDSEEGMGRMVLINGEAGIGKTQVLEEFQADARVHGMRILTGRCQESGGRAYGPFLEALQELAKKPRIEGTDAGNAVTRVLDELDRPVSNIQKDTYPAMEILSEFLVHLSREKPTLICIEDLQWADDLSLRFLDFMKRNPDPTSLVFGLTCRKEDEDPLPARLEAFTKETDAPGVVYLQLEPLSSEETTDLAASLIGEQTVPEEIAQRIYEQSGGNPLFIVELVRSSIEGGPISQDSSGRWTWRTSHEWPMPSGVVHAIEFRLRRLRAAQRQVLEYASIFRGAFSFDMISQVWRGDDLELLEALEGLVRLGLLSALEDSEGKHCFAHGLLQRAVYEGISEKKRLLLHQEAGKALEPRFETDGIEVLDDLAYHFSNSDDVEKMTRYLTESGRWALRMQDFSRALQQFEAVIEKQAFSSDAPAAVSLGSVAHLDYLCAYAEALCGCDRFDQARSELDKAMQWVSAETPALKADALRMLGICYSNSGENQSAETVLLDALDTYRNLGNDEMELMVLGLLPNVYLELGCEEAAVKYCQSAADRCRELGGDINEARAFLFLAFSEEILHETEQAKSSLESSLNLLDQTQDHLYRYTCLYLLGRIDVRLGNFDRAERIFQDLRDYWSRSGTKTACGVAWFYLGSIALERGDAAGAEAHLRSAERLLSDGGSHIEVYRACALLAESLAEIGHAEEALQWIDKARAGSEIDGNTRAAVLTAEAKVLAARGRDVDVDLLFERASQSQDPRNGLEHVRLLLFAGSYYLDNRRLPEARLYLENARSAAKAIGLSYFCVKASNMLELIPEEVEKGPTVTERSSALSEKHLATLCDVSQDLTSELDLDVLLDRVLERLTKVSGAERVLITLKEQTAFDVQVARAHRIEDSATREISRTIIKRTIARNEPILSLDAGVDERFEKGDSIVDFGIRSVLCIPLHHAESGVIGALYMDHRGLDQVFNESDMSFMCAFGNLVSIAVVNAWKYSQVLERALFLGKQVEDRYQMEGLVGRSQPIRDVFNLIEQAADSGATVLIQGETGTGKELAARAIHSSGTRKDRLFLSANCAALSPELLQSELFGHKKGAFTGATTDRKGLFESADGGTVLLDEIGDASHEFQSSLLRVLQEGEFQRVGETLGRRANVRVIASTNRDLESDVRNGRFREDLYYRLRVLQIEMPPLRNHIEDTPLLAEQILRRVCASHKKSVPGFTVGAMRVLMDHRWPGNVRELENEITRAVALVEEGKEISAGLFSVGIGLRQQLKDDTRGLFKSRVAAFERRMIIDALDQSGGNITQAANQLGLSRNGLQKMTKRFGLRAGTEKKKK